MAFVAAAWLVPVETVRHLVPAELPILSVLPGRTLATAFLGDYGPGSTLEYHELGVNPAVVRIGAVPAVWNAALVVDSEAARLGGELVGASKVVLPFDWAEERPGVGRCTVADWITVRYRQGRVPMPRMPVPTATLRDELLFLSLQALHGKARLGTASFEPVPGGPLEWMTSWGRPLVVEVMTGMRGRMMDRLQVARVFPHRAKRPPTPGSAERRSSFGEPHP